MPAPLVAAGIAAGAQVLSSGINAYAQGRMNKKTREWNEKMYGIQRTDALADWERQNAYNSPAAQMARLKEAGLNPNLVYGNGATATADAVRSTDVKSWNPGTPSFDIGSAATSGLAAYFDTQLKQGQIDMLEKQKTLLDTENLVKLADIKMKDWQSRRGEFDLAFDQMYQEVKAATLTQNLKKLQADTQYTLDQNERAAVSQNMSLSEAAERILNMRADRAKTADERQQIRAQIENLRKDGTLKDLDIQLRKMGINPNDPIYWRMLGQQVNSTGGLNILGRNKEESERNHRAFRSGFMSNQYLRPFIK